MMRSDRQRGVALLMMLMIAALAAALVAGMIQRQGRVQRELVGQLQQDQIAEYLRGASFFAMAALKADAENGGLDVDHPGEFWARPFPPFPVPGGVIQPTLRDAQARFNLNSLVAGGVPNAAALGFYRRLLAYLLLPPDLADSLVDWQDNDSQPTLPGGAEDDFYLRQPAPYRAANRSLSTYQELRLVRGYSSEVLRQLSPWVTVLPNGANTLNANFIAPGMLEALVPGMSPTSAVALLQNRPLAGWRSVPEFLDNPVFNGLSPDLRQQVQSLLTVRSGYFELYTRVRLGDRVRRQWSLIARNGNQVRVIANERNPAWMPDSESGPASAPTGTEEKR